MKVLVPLGWLKLEVDPTKVLAHAFVRRRRRRECVLEGKKALVMAACSIIYLTQMDKEIHYKKERNLDIPFHCTTAIQRWEARS
jgi:hypothetical protein